MPNHNSSAGVNVKNIFFGSSVDHDVENKP